MVVDLPRHRRDRFLAVGRRYSADWGPGLAASLALHGLIAALILLFMMRTGPATAPEPAIVPIDVIRLGEETLAPPAPARSPIPQQKAEYKKQEAASPVPPAGEAPNRRQDVDLLDAKLRALARLKQPESNLRIVETPAASDTNSTSDDAAPGDEATYAVRDFVRAQVERHWNLDLHALAGHSYIIPIRIEITASGVVTRAEIVDRERYTNDAAYRSIALSARNAVLLSSPIAFPSGALHEKLVLTLDFNPRDTLR